MAGFILRKSQNPEGNSIDTARNRPCLAYISPLPPEKSGIADYSADLLPELAKFYDISAVIAQPAVVRELTESGISLRSVEWFDRHAAELDVILYHFGSSPLHRHMPALLSRHPGIVVLHDFFLGELLNSSDSDVRRQCPPAHFKSHQRDAQMLESVPGYVRSMREHPCNRLVLEQASGMIVHSRFSMHLADQWYGAGASAGWRCVPIPKPMADRKEKRAARQRLGISADDFVVASFGFIVPFKLNDRLIDAWIRSPMVRDKRCRLILVGECNDPDYAQALRESIERSGCDARIHITGFVDRETYRDYLESADIAAQLRLHSRGETSAAVLDCLAYGIPTVVNAHGSAAELPGNALLKLREEFTQAELCDSLTGLWRNVGLREILSAAAIRHVGSFHDPARVGRLYRDAIEHFRMSRLGMTSDTMPPRPLPVEPVKHS